MEYSNNKFNIGDYVIVNNKYVGLIVKSIWNSKWNGNTKPLRLSSTSHPNWGKASVHPLFDWLLFK